MERSKRQSDKGWGILSFDAFLFQSFGGPNNKSDVIQFLENVTSGRNIPKERLETVAQQYYLFGGKSPINEINLDIIKRLEAAFQRNGIQLPIYFGNRNFEPYVADALARMKADGVKRALCFVTSAYGSFSGCKQYKLDIENAQKLLGNGAPEVVKIRHYYSHPGFTNPLVANSITALRSLPDTKSAHLAFTAHSIPQAMADTSPYLEQLHRALDLVVAGIESQTGQTFPSALVFQSRSGPPDQAWLEPDVSDHLARLAMRGTTNVAIVPISFISEHMEVIYDLDTLAAAKATELGMSVVRAKTPSDSPEFIDMIVDLTQELLDRRKRPATLGTYSNLNGCTSSCCPAPPRVAKGTA